MEHPSTRYFQAKKDEANIKEENEQLLETDGLPPEKKTELPIGVASVK